MYGSLCAQFDYEFILVTFMTTRTVPPEKEKKKEGTKSKLHWTGKEAVGKK